jgi:lyso-ornithine lipid O-acyltransferase
MKAATSNVLRPVAAEAATPNRRRASAFRATWRALWLGGEILLAALRFGWAWVRCGGAAPRRVRARCLQASCQRILRVFDAGLRVGGIPPNRGLLVCNHLSYLDILVIGATTPCVFISKSDVRRWPVFGWFAARAGTLFVRRERRTDAARIMEEIRAVLGEEILVVLFPEGTSTGGTTVLPFKSALLGAVEATAHPTTSAAVGYALHDGDAGEEVCYWKDMTLVPHLWNLLGKRSLRAALGFGSSKVTAHEDRKGAAIRLYSEVLELKRSIDATLQS